jgi:hypothetical protein
MERNEVDGYVPVSRRSERPPVNPEVAERVTEEVIRVMTSSLPAGTDLRQRLASLVTAALASRETLPSEERQEGIEEHGSPLELSTDTGGIRYFLDGRPIHNGETIEVALQEGGWLALRLEGMPREIWGYGLPILAGGYQLVVKVPPAALFRWPAYEGRPR